MNVLIIVIYAFHYSVYFGNTGIDNNMYTLIPKIVFWHTPTAT